MYFPLQSGLSGGEKTPTKSENTPTRQIFIETFYDAHTS